MDLAKHQQIMRGGGFAAPPLPTDGVLPEQVTTQEPVPDTTDRPATPANAESTTGDESPQQ